MEKLGKSTRVETSLGSQPGERSVTMRRRNYGTRHIERVVVPQPDPSLGIAELRAAIRELQLNLIEVTAAEKVSDEGYPVLWLGFKRLSLDDLGVKRPAENSPAVTDTVKESE